MQSAHLAALQELGDRVLVHPVVLVVVPDRNEDIEMGEELRSRVRT